jgi:hypothetical protein
MKITNQFKSRLRTYFIKRLGAFDYSMAGCVYQLAPIVGENISWELTFLCIEPIVLDVMPILLLLN